MTYFVLALYAIGTVIGFWTAWFCGTQAEKCVGRAKRWEDDPEEVEYWVERGHWWVRQGYYNLAGSTAFFVCGAIYAWVVLWAR